MAKLNFTQGLILVSIVCMMLGSAMLFIAYHNIDISWNMKRNSIDTPVYGTPMNEIQVYNTGVKQIQFSFMFFIIGYILLVMVFLKNINTEIVSRS